jgi:hypothetical protein
MRSNESTPHPVPPAGTQATHAPQEDEHVACVIPALEAIPAQCLDWDGLIASGNTPCLALGAERRTKKRD